MIDNSKVMCAVETFLDEHNLNATPDNYALAYRYVQKNSRSLCEAVEQKLYNEGGLNEASAKELFNTYIVQHDQDTEQIYPALHQLLEQVTGAISSSHNESSGFLDTLHQSNENLQKQGSHDELVELVDLLTQSTSSVISSQEALSEQLHSAEEESKSLKERLDKASRDAMEDELTGLLNRKGFRKCIEELTAERAVPLDQVPYSIVSFDVDHFKNVNDTYGHLFGDKVLHNTAEVILKSVRGNDIAVRFGGEEFILLLPDTDLDGARLVAEKVRTTIEKVRWINRRTGKKLDPITLSAGISANQHSMALEEVIELADVALYQAKGAGRNRSCIYQPD
ncbi:GGDEF domain-containing protein [Neptuniibacter caesariensis]|uniref:diguanylate cyclase n=1 Tax=Neptuniibacter caesariensis TaxID=207954 RepID=A0A7U8GTH1_NEPCE|nr:GGDEF domain-containing protein [Neptuniibacter caesariensis]EAR62287.1 putative diguanylate cyclase (GGDEF) [Oceanospirillum sp. MED92] [Neptuniibacter caesariensis]